MKLLFCLCFLVSVSSSVSQGQTPTVPPGTKDLKSMVSNENVDSFTSQTGTLHPSKTQQTLNETENEATDPTQPKTTLLASTSPTTLAERTTEEDKTTTSDENEEVTTVATTTEAAPVASSKAGYVVLVLIIIIIIILCVILYMLRRASRTYSFDLHGPGPSRHQDEPVGTFGQVYVDDLNQPAPNDIEMTDLTTTPVANGTSPEPEPVDNNVSPEDAPETKDVQNSPSSSFSSSSEDEGAEKTSNKLSSSNFFFDAPEEQQNENNNNNPSVGSSCPFVEINLDEPAWCDQLLTSPPASSSVCPFSSSSSSS